METAETERGGRLILSWHAPLCTAGLYEVVAEILVFVDSMDKLKGKVGR